MKKQLLTAIMLLLVSVFALTSCSLVSTVDAPADSAEPQTPAETEPITASAAPEEEPSEEPAAEVPQAEEPVSLSEEAREAYRSALSAVLNDHILPDGTDLGYDEIGDVSDNQFAVYDIDGDGRDELIVIYTTTATASQMLCVFDYQDGEIHSELFDYPMPAFYDNGTVKVGWSHSQGLAGEFWPFNLYQYDAASDSYTLVGMVDAWDKRLSDTDTEGNAFPDDIDTSKTGIVYYIMTNGEYDTSTPVDASAFNEWFDSYTAGAAEVSLPFTDLTADNIAAV